MKCSIYSYLSLCFLAILLIACGHPDPNINPQGRDEFKSLELDHDIDESQMSYAGLFYVPIYSDLYINSQNQKTLFAATLSIRNTSLSDSLFVSKIDYYNNGGDLVRSYIDKPISLPPVGSVNYVIEKEDDTGGTGANFIVGLTAKNNKIKPIIQAVMIGELGNKGFAFATDAYPID